MEKIQHRLIISGKVKDVVAQINMLCKQFPEGTITDVCEAYGLQEVILK